MVGIFGRNEVRIWKRFLEMHLWIFKLKRCKEFKVARASCMVRKISHWLWCERNAIPGALSWRNGLQSISHQGKQGAKIFALVSEVRKCFPGGLVFQNALKIHFRTMHYHCAKFRTECCMVRKLALRAFLLEFLPCSPLFHLHFEFFKLPTCMNTSELILKQLKTNLQLRIKTKTCII